MGEGDEGEGGKWWWRWLWCVWREAADLGIGWVANKVVVFNTAALRSALIVLLGAGALVVFC